jgi:hypothetical protein
MTEETKRISDLQLKAAGPDASDDFVVDTGTLTQRVTGQQVLDFIAVNGKVPAYKSTVTYSINDFVVSSGVFYKSLANANVGNALTDVTKWVPVSRESNCSTVADNYSIVASIASNALTISLKTQAGTDPTALDFATIAFRNTAAGSGSFTLSTIKSALSMSISSGSTLGFASATSRYLYIYGVLDGTTSELMASARRFHSESGNNGLVTTTAEGGIGGADSGLAGYSVSSHSSVPFRLLCRKKFSLTTAGLWDELPDSIELPPFEDEPFMTDYNRATTVLSVNSASRIVFSTKTTDTHNAYNVSNGQVTVPETGIYNIDVTLNHYFTSPDNLYDKTLMAYIYVNDVLVYYAKGTSLGAANTIGSVVSKMLPLNSGDVIQVWGYQEPENSGVTLNDSIGYQRFSVTRVR